MGQLEITVWVLSQAYKQIELTYIYLLFSVICLNYDFTAIHVIAIDKYACLNWYSIMKVLLIVNMQNKCVFYMRSCLHNVIYSITTCLHIYKLSSYF